MRRGRLDGCERECRGEVRVGRGGFKSLARRLRLSAILGFVSSKLAVKISEKACAENSGTQGSKRSAPLIPIRLDSWDIPNESVH